MSTSTDILKKIGDAVLMEIAAEFILQGHDLTGTALKSLRFEIKGDKLVFYGVSYLVPLNSGVPANRIPYSGRTGRGGTSKYIQGLVAFALKLGKTQKEALSVAFAIANKQKKEGMPTSGSRRFSKNGKRKGFIQDAAKKVPNIVGRILLPEIINEVKTSVKNGLRNIQVTT